MRKVKCPYLPDLWALRDGESDEARAAEVREHMAECPACQEEQRELERLSAALQAGDAAAEMPPQKHERLKQALLQACAHTPTCSHTRTPTRLSESWASVLRRFRSLSPARRFAFAMTVPVAAASLLLLLFLTAETPAQALERTLNAMAQVKSAHCVGWFVSYMDKKPDGQPISGRMKVEWWYKAPNKYRRNLGPEVRGWSVSPGQLILNGRQGIFVDQFHAARGMVSKVDRAVITRDLSPFDFFSEEGIIRRAMSEKGAQVTRRQGVFTKRKVPIITLQIEGEKSRHHWILYIDSALDLILKSEWTWDWKKGTSWQPAFKETLEHFTYNIKVQDSLFQVENTRISLKPTKESK